MNKLELTGNIVRDPQFITIGSNTKAIFTLAVKREYGDQTDFLPCQIWNNDYIKELKKGDHVQVKGQWISNNYDRKDGTKVYQTVGNITEITR